MPNYYVSRAGDDKSNGQTMGAAFRTLQKAADIARAGDTVYVMDGIYTSPYAYILSFNNKQGTAENPIIFTAMPGHKPVIQAISKNWQAISICGSSYIVIDGLTLLGARDSINYEYAIAQKDKLDNPATSGSGIFINAIAGASKKRSHHITIKNCNVVNFPGGGIGGTETDYIVIENNTVSGCSYYSPYGTQGISFLRSFNFDDNTTDYRIIIRGNKSFENKQLVPWKVAGKITEGNGIILDTSYADNVAYTGKVLIENNISYNNGGAGIQIFKGENPVDIVNNTIYQNSKVVSYGEIFFNAAKNVRVSDNILYGSGKDIVVLNKSTSLTFENNLAYNGNFKVSGTGNLIGKDPLFSDATNGDFTLKPQSPAFWNEVKKEVQTVKEEDILTTEQIITMLTAVDSTIGLNDSGAIARITETQKEVETIIKHPIGAK